LGAPDADASCRPGAT
jgi:hypothetical protein